MFLKLLIIKKSFISKEIKNFYIKKKYPLKIIHITNFNQRFNGRFITIQEKDYKMDLLDWVIMF